METSDALWGEGAPVNRDCGRFEFGNRQVQLSESINGGFECHRSPARSPRRQKRRQRSEGMLKRCSARDEGEIWRAAMDQLKAKPQWLRLMMESDV